MGLDMYLEADVYIGGQHDFKEARGGLDVSLKSLARAVGGDEAEERERITIPATQISSVTLSVGYWRKANQIHNWFVKNVQEGKDECQRSYVSPDDLHELRKACDAVLIAKDDDVSRDLLPPQEGFFFGAYEIDDWYYRDIEETLDIVDEALRAIDEQDATIYYHASW